MIDDSPMSNLCMKRLKICVVTNMYPSPDRPFYGTFIEQQVAGLNAARVATDVLHLDRDVVGAKVYLHAGRRVQEQIRAFDPNLVHVMYGGIMAEEVTRTVRDRPVIVSYCGSDLLGDLLSGLHRKLISRVGVWASQIAARRAAGIVVKSRNLERALAGDIDRRKLRIIPNGVDLERFKVIDQSIAQQHLGWDAERFHVIFPTNMGDPRKRPWLAEAAIERLQSWGVPAELHRLRGVPHTDVPYWLNASHCVLLTSLHEGSPNVIKEALACNVPVVSVDVGDVAERVNGIEGCFISSPEPGELADRLRRVAQGLRRVDGRVHMQSLSLESITRNLLELYDDVLEGRLSPASLEAQHT